VRWSSPRRRTPLQAGTSRLRASRGLSRRPYRPRRKSDAEWRKARGEVLKRAVNRCEARLPRCSGEATHVHHVLRRSQGGTNEPDNLLAVCFLCHEWIHANPKEAAAAGLLRLRKCH
jgi:5-methylcytosine-specific restriction endonuclease McrA